MQLNGLKYFACIPPHPETGVGVKRSNSTFSKHGHVAYQIKGKHKMQQHSSNYFARSPPNPPTPNDPGDGMNRSKFNFFRTWS